MRVCLFHAGIEDNTGRPSSNLGDLIIEQAVRRELATVFPRDRIRPVSTQVYPGWREVRRILRSQWRIVGGTNLLSSNMDSYRQWKLDLLHASYIRNAILMGVGWWQYQDAANAYTCKLLHRCLSQRALHSVRDSYAEQKLRAAGFSNVINTGCPTMWPLAAVRPDEIPRHKSAAVLLMLTDYYSRPELDARLVELLLQRYRQVFFWPQGRRDLEVLWQFKRPLTVLPPSVPALEEFLNSRTLFDYVGTRLHGGVMCLLARRRSLILEVDNRAREIARDTGLPTAGRDDFDGITRWITGPTETKLRLNTAAIAQWRAQFGAAPQVMPTAGQETAFAVTVAVTVPLLAATKPVLVNLGCGRHFHPDWVNLDLTSHAPGVVQHDLRDRLPFADASCDAVYHSHVLEHFTRPAAAAFLRECHRVLKPGGTLRVVVPDLETIARLYLHYLDRAVAGDARAAERYDWMTIELLDQMVRQQGGGEMLHYWQSDPMPAEDFVVERVGAEVRRFLEWWRTQPPAPPAAPGEPSAEEQVRFRQSGEVHKWMYDRWSLKNLLTACGFTDACACAAHESRVPDFGRYQLDVQPGGSTRKPDSLFMEAMKPPVGDNASHTLLTL